MMCSVAARAAMGIFFGDDGVVDVRMVDIMLLFRVRD
jgi:hypothetical protein